MTAVNRVNKATFHYLLHYKSQGPSDNACGIQSGNKHMEAVRVLVNLWHSLLKHVVHAKALPAAQEALSQLLERKIR